MSLEDLRLRRDFATDPKYRKVYRQILREKARIDAEQKTKALFEKRANNRNFARQRFKTNVTSESQPEQTLHSNDVSYGYGNDSVNLGSDSGAKHVLSLDKFFERPVLVDTFELSVATPETWVVDVLEAWSSDPTVRAKLSHYAYFKGDMKVKFVVSSSKFHYGCLLISHQPYFTINPSVQALINAADIVGTNFALANYLTQSPEHVVLRIGEDETIELSLPLIIPTNALRLFNTSNTVMTNATPYDDLLNKIVLVYQTLVPVKAANDDENSLVTIETYAWVDNIELGPPTSTDINVTAESAPVDSLRSKVNSNQTLNHVAGAVESFVSDEYADAGPLTKIASAVSGIASTASSVPILGVAARATSLAASAAAKVFKFFGFSKPANIENIIHVKNLPYSNGVVLDGQDTALKLSADPKQELSVQPLGGEMSVDPMAISYIASRESFFHQFNWSDTDVPRVSTLATFPISPMIHTHQGSTPIVQPTALAFAAWPFQHWRGTITFRFEVIASAFHRGKLMFIYEPNIEALALIQSAETNLNQQYIYYLDISESRDLTIDCGFVHHRLVADVHATSDASYELTPATITFDSSAATAIGGFYNAIIGSIYVRPLTKLTAPSANSDNDVKVNCYIYSDDIEFSVPVSLQNIGLSRSFPEPAARSVEVTAESSPENTEGVQSKMIGTNIRKTSLRECINRHKPSNENVYSYHFGERISSFRSLLKRDMGIFEYTAPNSGTGGLVSFSFPMYPPPAADWKFEGIDPIFDFTPAELGTNVSLFDYLRHAYIGMKGGFRYKLLRNTNSAGHLGKVIVQRFEKGLTDYDFVGTAGVGNIYHIEGTGTLVLNENDNTGVDFEIPYYSNCLFDLPMVQSSSQYFVEGMDMFSARQQHVKVWNDVGPSFAPKYDVIAHAAEDFTFFRFQGASPWVEE